MRNALVGGNMPTTGISNESDKTGMSAQHFNRNAQDAAQQGVEVQFFCECSRDFEQVFPLAYSVVR